MQGRKLDRNRRCGEYIRVWAARANGFNRIAIGLLVAVGIFLGQCAFAEHVEAVAVLRVIAVA